MLKKQICYIQIEDIEKIDKKTSLQRKVEEYVLAGNKLHSGCGIIDKQGA